MCGKYLGYVWVLCGEFGRVFFGICVGGAMRVGGEIVGSAREGMVG